MSQLISRPAYQRAVIGLAHKAHPTVEQGRVYPDMVVSDGLFPFLSSILAASPTPSLALGLLNPVIYSSASDLFDEDGPDIGSWKGTLHCESTTATAAAKTETWSPVMGLGYLNLTRFQRVLSFAPSPTPSRGSRNSELCKKYFRRLESYRSESKSSNTTAMALSPFFSSDFISRVIPESTAQVNSQPKIESPTDTLVHLNPMIVDSAQATYSFYYTGSYQTFYVPAGVTFITVYAYGAQGASTSYSSGGLGGYIVSTVSVTPNTYLYVYVGGAGSGSTGGYNGGGYGGNSYAGGGGGATDIRTGYANLYSRLVVAGGGGGAGYDGGTTNINGGGGGGLTGLSGSSDSKSIYGGSSYGGSGGSQSSGGAGGYFSIYYSYGSSGAYGFGGAGGSGTQGGGVGEGTMGAGEAPGRAAEVGPATRAGPSASTLKPPTRETAMCRY